MQVVIDFETASAVDLTVVGSARYWEDPTTEILVLCWKTSGGQRGRWAPGDVGDDLKALAADPTIKFVAHNAAFEINGWRQQMVPVYGFPDIVNNRWEDTMAVCAMKAIPLKLEHAVKVLDLPVQKDMEGSKLTRKLSKPNKKGEFDRSPATMARVAQYCDTDVDAEELLDLRVGKLSRGERAVWLLDLTINQRGVKLDMPYVLAAQQVVDRATEPLLSEFSALTGGLAPGQVEKIMDWCDDHGTLLPNLQKATIAAALGVEDEPDDEEEDQPDVEDRIRGLTLSPEVRRALEIRRTTGSASIKKLRRMSLCVNLDGRARGLLQYHAAGPGRWGGRLIQPQNFPRGVVHLDEGTKNERAPDPDVMVQTIMTGDPDYVAAMLGDPIDVVLSGLRHALVPDRGRLFSVGDFAGIEARIVLALAGQHDKTALLASGADVYCDVASLIYGRTITKANVPERQVGKNTVLGCGFGMGWAKFQLRYASHMTEEFCRKIIDTYRKEWAPLVPKLWYALEAAAIKAVWEGGAHEAFGVTFQLNDGWLTSRLPSGRRLWYENPQKTLVAKPWAPDELTRAWTYQAKKSGRWRTIHAYGALLAENVVQALARDLLVRAMFQCEANNIPVVLTVHDEIVGEPDEALANATLLEQIMASPPRWAEEIKLPIKAECWIGDRYRK